MNYRSCEELDALPLDAKQAIDAACDEFEAAWKSGDGPAIENLLSHEPDHRQVLLKELLVLERHYLSRAGAMLAVEEYLARFPNDREIVQSVFQQPISQRRGGQAEDRPPNSPITIDFKRSAANPVGCDTSHRDGPDSSTRVGHQGLAIRCPDCHSSIQAAVESSVAEITCTACGSTFSLLGMGSEVSGAPAERMVGHFELIDRLGAGGFGTVWKARDTQLDRMVAVKIPRRGQLARDEAELFLREARAAAQLNHPHIVSVHEVGRHDDSIYIVSDLVHGDTLSEWISQRRPSFREAAKLCADIAAAVHYAHAQGVVHRDLKPQNILIDGENKSHIMDFGLAKREVGERTMTMEGQVLGTPAYMSPEQARGAAHTADRRTDVYSLGVILFELLTGDLPFRGNARMLLQQVMHDEPPSPRKLNAQVPPDLETICLKCLEKRSEKRYQTAADLEDELLRFLSGKAIVARPVSKVEHFWRWCKRNPVYTGLSATIILVSLLGFAAVSRQLLKTVAAERRETLALVNNLKTADSESLPVIIDNLDPHDDEVARRLRNLLAEQSGPAELRASLVLLRTDSALAGQVLEGLLAASPPEFLAARKILQKQTESQRESLLSDSRATALLSETLAAESAVPSRRVRAASLLGDSDLIADYADFITTQMLQEISRDPRAYSHYLEMFRDGKDSLIEALTRIFEDPSTSASDQLQCAHLLAEYTRDDVPKLASLVTKATNDQFQPLMKCLSESPIDEAERHLLARLQQYLPGGGRDLDSNSRTDDDFLNDRSARQAANAALALAHLGRAQHVWPLLKLRKDNSIRSHIIDRLPKLHADPAEIVQILRDVDDDDIRFALLLALAGYPIDSVPSDSADLIDELCLLYGRDPHPGIHSALRFLLAAWQQHERVVDLDRQSAGREPMERQWLVNEFGHTLVMLTLPAGTSSTGDAESRRFAIGTTEITVAEIRAYDPDWGRAGMPYLPRTEECPAMSVFWSQAASYCNWLSEQEGLPEDQWCYEVVRKERGLPYLLAKPDSLQRAGYRLPTESEWEHACRAGAATARFFAEGAELMPEYAWVPANTLDGHVRPVATKKPNDFGMFDMYGNAIEWCHDVKKDAPQYRALRGLGAGDLAVDRSDFGDAAPNVNVQIAGNIGFRIARTLHPHP